jgi:hypothetical protein
MTGRSQPSPTPSLNGSREQEWTRGEHWQAYEGKGVQYLVELQEKAA